MGKSTCMYMQTCMHTQRHMCTHTRTHTNTVIKTEAGGEGNREEFYHTFCISPGVIKIERKT